MILFFTGTGNSRHVAEKLAELTGDGLLCINEYMRRGEVYEGGDEKLIVVAPTYAWRLPLVVSDWLRKSVISSSTRIWFVMSCGGEIGNAAKYNIQLCDQKSLNYMGSAGVKMPDNYIIMFNSEEHDKAKTMLISAEERIVELAEYINSDKAFDKPRNNIYDRLMSSIVNPAFYRNVKADGYHIEGECISCRKCENVCPLNNVKLVNGQPEWGKNCTHCMACISYCPVGIIEYSKKTRGKEKYTYEKYSTYSNV